MGVYVIAQISITDSEAYNRYQNRFRDVFRKFKGQLLAAEENPQIVEGEWNRDKLILMRFPNEEAFKEWAFSAEYQEISKDREAGSEGVVLLAKSIN